VLDSNNGNHPYLLIDVGDSQFAVDFNISADSGDIP